jgi:hypothetical protein
LGGGMSQSIEVEDIKRLDIRDGETLVVTLPPRATVEQADKVLAALRHDLPNVNVRVFEHGTRFDVLCPSSPA